MRFRYKSSLPIKCSDVSSDDSAVDVRRMVVAALAELAKLAAMSADGELTKVVSDALASTVRLLEAATRGTAYRSER